MYQVSNPKTLNICTSSTVYTMYMLSELLLKAILSNFTKLSCLEKKRTFDMQIITIVEVAPDFDLPQT